MRLTLPGKNEGVAVIIGSDRTVTIRLPDGTSRLDGCVWDAVPVPRPKRPHGSEWTFFHRLGMPIDADGPKGALLVVLVTFESWPDWASSIPFRVEVLVHQGPEQCDLAEAVATAWGCERGEEFNIPLVGALDLAANPDVCAAFHFGKAPLPGEAALLLYLPDWEEPCGDAPGDSLYEAVVRLCSYRGRASTALVQRAFYIGYDRAAKLIEAAREAGDLP